MVSKLDTTPPYWSIIPLHDQISKAIADAKEEVVRQLNYPILLVFQKQQSTLYYINMKEMCFGRMMRSGRGGFLYD